MAYAALYRKYRPALFEDVKGQDAIVTTLKNQIKSGRISHAYLFCGTRGTGKTTVAKILAKAVNCENLVDATPCEKCQSCTEINNGSSVNVIEIDAASNNGVDDIRNIREEIQYPPTSGKYRVYIIDEVHMLSGAAFNALLKTLEEPPEYVIFILATTEAHKIPATITSRCQRYNFKRISIDTITNRLKELMQKENITVQDRALEYIARVADGSMRDSLSLLDRCLAFYMNEELTYDKVLEALGSSDITVYHKLCDSIIRSDISQTVSYVSEMIGDGREPGQLLTDFIWYLRNLLLAGSVDDPARILDASDDTIRLLKEQAADITQDKLIRFINILSEASDNLRYSTQKRVSLEIAFIKLMKPELQGIPAGDQISIAQTQAIQSVPSKVPAAENTGTAPKPKLAAALTEDIKLLASNYRKLVSQIGAPLKDMLKTSRVSVSGNGNLMIIMPDETGYGFVVNRKEQIENYFSTKLQKDVKIDISKPNPGKRIEDEFVDLEKEGFINMKVEVSDDI